MERENNVLPCLTSVERHNLIGLQLTICTPALKSRTQYVLYKQVMYTLDSLVEFYLTLFLVLHTTFVGYLVFLFKNGGLFANRTVFTLFRLDTTLQWRHNEPNGVSNHRGLDCLLNTLFRRRTKKTTKLRFAALCEGNSPVTRLIPNTKGQ